MIKIKFNSRYIKAFKKLPYDIKNKAVLLEDIFKKDPFDRRLQTKKLKGEIKDFYSFRVTQSYRIIFRVTSINEVEFLLIKHRKDIYKT